MAASNMSGSEKVKLLIIGKSAKARCFTGIKSLSVDYYYNKRAWMTSEIFERWVMKLDRQFTAQGRKIILLIDNCPAHPRNLQPKLKSIKLSLFPPKKHQLFSPSRIKV